jgi:hypothetical protein
MYIITTKKHNVLKIHKKFLRLCSDALKKILCVFELGQCSLL